MTVTPNNDKDTRKKIGYSPISFLNIDIKNPNQNINDLNPGRVKDIMTREGLLQEFEG